MKLNPNCSEEVFRLTGSLKDIKKQMLNMAEWIEGEYTGTYGDGPIEKLSPQIKTSLNDLRKKIKDAKSLEDLELIVIDFTCNYETFFKAKEGDLLVATCNNYSWGNVEKEDVYGDDENYYTAAGYSSYEKVAEIEGYTILKHCFSDEDYKDGNNPYPRYIFPEKGSKLVFDNTYRANEIKLVIRGKWIYALAGNNLIKINEVGDKKMLNKLKIAACIDDKK